ncbi:CBM35 domain-containing protein [Nonomuraea typhae]|uniref:CBM35 domain-containing protein n=1 Tax=Nonomuraea typhae TaxID=2603600 RepID=UPI0012F84150|nr:hypothetical protein [Nonomuraea typhae]
MKRIVLTTTLLAAALVTPAQAQARTATPPLVILNPGFEKGAEAWTFTPGTGVATNNPHGGTRLIYLDSGPGKSVRQTITVPATGRYSISAWIATGGAGGTFTATVNGAQADSVTLPARSIYSRYTLTGLSLTAGDTLEIAFGSGNGWVNADDLMISPAAPASPVITSGNTKIVAMFDWAKAKAASWVHQDGVVGPINIGATNPVDPGEAPYTPTYWAGYAHRTAYYSRDLAHQLAGAQILGFSAENKNMLRSFAASATPEHKYYPVWAINFDAKTWHTIDYKSPVNFVREVPATFELVEKANQAFRWTGDRSYLDDPVFWDYYRNATTGFVAQHDGARPNGVAEGTGKGIFQGVASYNEVSREPLAEAGDGIGAQYQAFRALAEMAQDKHEVRLARTTARQATDLKRYFNQTWSVKPGTGEFVRAYTIDGTPLTGFGKENSWFMPMKGIVEAGPRNEAYLDFIDTEATGAGRPANIEAITYLPDTFFRHNRNETAWKWMQHVYDERETRHVSNRQGLNGDYPEVPFTLVSQTVEGLMGVQPDAPRRAVATQSRLPGDIPWLQVAAIPVGAGTVDVRHDGRASTTFTNRTGAKIAWEARFPAGHRWLTVDGRRKPGTQKVIDGVTYTVTVVNVPDGRSTNVTVAS